MARQTCGLGSTKQRGSAQLPFGQRRAGTQILIVLAIACGNAQLVDAQSSGVLGAPPPDAAALVTAPKGAADAPKIENPEDGTTASLSAGGQQATGNSRLLAGTLNSAAETRWSNNGLGGSLVGNYGRSGPQGSKMVTTAENIQGRVRYDRYLIEQASVFLINTGRHDRFQGIQLRYNLDPGFKYLFISDTATTLWAEAGYDLQYDVRREDARMPAGSTTLLDKTATDHSGRAYGGVKHAFNPDVALSSGIELMQSFVHGDHTRVNFDALLTATVGSGFSFGLGFGARYDAAPLPGKRDLDTSTTVSVIYSYSSAVAAEAKAEDKAEEQAEAAEAAQPTAAAETPAATEAPAPAPATAPAAEPATTAPDAQPAAAPTTAPNAPAAPADATPAPQTP
ncbi:MAG TPA: DUF481 domain-containing protein [Polyangiales bacterium]